MVPRPHGWPRKAAPDRHGVPGRRPAFSTTNRLAPALRASTPNPRTTCRRRHDRLALVRHPNARNST